MRVLHIISSGGMYGAETVILSLSRTMNRSSHHSSLGVISNLSQPSLQLYDAAVREGINAHVIPCQGQIDKSVPDAIHTLAQQTGADVIHAHGYKADIYSYLAVRKSHIPVVSTCHGWIDNGLAVRAYGMVDRFALRSFAGVVAVSDEVRQRLLSAGLRKDQVRQIQNGIDLRPFVSLHGSMQDQSGKDYPLKVGLVARLSHEKGVDLFLRSTPAVLSEMPLTQFFVVGDGPDKTKLESLIEELGVKQNVFLLGRKENMPEFYSSMDLLVLSSRQEGLPMALLEGMASGLPFVAAAIGGVPKVVQDGRTGILVKVEDVEQLATAIIKLLQEPATRKSYGAAARKLVTAQYTSERMMEDYLQLYSQVTQK